jgi:Maintenance of mitochondrial structure and function
MLMNVTPILPRVDTVVSVLETQANAIRMLQARIDTIKEYLVDVQDGISFGGVDVGKIPPNEHMLKEISSLLYRLPAASSREFVDEFEDSWGAVLLASLFTEILKGTGDIQEVSNYCRC